MKYKIDKNYFIVEKLDDKAEGKDVIELDEELDLILTWEFNDYSCYRWQYRNKLIENRIALFAMTQDNKVTGKGNIIEAITRDVLSVHESAVEIEPKIAKELRDEYSYPKYKIQNGKVTRVRNDKIDKKIVDRRVETEISNEISIGRELKIIIDMIDWIVEQKPRSDKRFKAYNKMREEISKIKEKLDT